MGPGAFRVHFFVLLIPSKSPKTTSFSFDLVNISAIIGSHGGKMVGKGSRKLCRGLTNALPHGMVSGGEAS